MLGKAAYYSKGVSISEPEITGFKSASPLNSSVTSGWCFSFHEPFGFFSK